VKGKKKKATPSAEVISLEGLLNGEGGRGVLFFIVAESRQSGWEKRKAADSPR